MDSPAGDHKATQRAVETRPSDHSQGTACPGVPQATRGPIPQGQLTRMPSSPFLFQILPPFSDAQFTAPILPDLSSRQTRTGGFTWRASVLIPLLPSCAWNRNLRHYLLGLWHSEASVPIHRDLSPLSDPRCRWYLWVDPGPAKHPFSSPDRRYFHAASAACTVPAQISQPEPNCFIIHFIAAPPTRLRSWTIFCAEFSEWYCK